MRSTGNTTSGVYRKIMATRASNARNAVAETQRRMTDPVEEAKLILRRAGYNTYAEKIERPRSDKFVCGTKRMTAAELIAYAADVQHRRSNPCRMTG